LKPTSEYAFETTVEQTLLRRSGWKRGDLAEWDERRALFRRPLLDFLRSGQPKTWAKLETQIGADALPGRLVETLLAELAAKGALEVLRHGFRFHGETLRLAWFRPAHGLNEETAALYERNELTVTRQVPCHPGKGSTVDLVLALNGLPVATVELKNPATGQSWRDAARQYRKDRDPAAPLFRFPERTLAHFAADPDEVRVTTRLMGEQTKFLPFNRGSLPGEAGCGAGNPPNPEGYRTAYFWEGTLARDSFLDILGRFLFLEKRNGNGTGSRAAGRRGGGKRRAGETLVFPRYHQLDAVRRLTEEARSGGPGNNYLIQHSAGSGKTNSIAWLAHRLMSLHDEEDRLVFDSVVVITDRRVLDQQLRQAIYQIEHAQGVVRAIDRDSRQLAGALAGGARIVVTTQQKFPFVLRGLYRVAGAESEEAATEAERDRAAAYRTEIAARRYAVIVDEAHSSQSGETAREFKAILGAGGGAVATRAEDRDDADGVEDDDGDDDGDDDEQDDPGSRDDFEDQLNRVIAARGPQPNLSFFAFTATPKGKTLELFGRKTPEGGRRPSHLYSMRQAIEEEFILDVLERYTPYRSFWKLLKEIPDDPEVPERKAMRALRRFITLHPTHLAQKTEIIVEHFRSRVLHRLGGRAKAMVVTSSRLHAVRYLKAFEKYLGEKGYADVRPLVAFSGEVSDPDTGLKYTETGMNERAAGRRISEAALAGEFATDEFRVLLVAEKYQTGFDQPLLAAMYVDKRLDGVQAVQTLSRLNRIHPGKEAPFILDFVNAPDDIQRAFRPYYDRTELAEPTDPQHLETLKHQLDESGIVLQSELEGFARVFFKSSEKQRPGDHAEIERWIQPAVDRFRALDDEEEQEEFRSRLSAFVRIYAYLSQVLPYGDREWEARYAFGRQLLPRLGRDPSEWYRPSGVELEYLRVRDLGTEDLSVREEGPGFVTAPTETGTGSEEEERAPLSQIIEVLNDRFGTEFGEADRLFFVQVRESASGDEEVAEMAQANPFDTFLLGIEARLETLMSERSGANERIVERFHSDPEFRSAVVPELARAIFEAVARPAD